MCVLALNMMKASGESCGKGLGEQILVTYILYVNRVFTVHFDFGQQKQTEPRKLAAIRWV